MADEVQPGQPSADPPQSASFAHETAQREARVLGVEITDESISDPTFGDDLEFGDAAELIENSSVGDSAVDLPDDVGSRVLVPHVGMPH